MGLSVVVKLDSIPRTLSAELEVDDIRHFHIEHTQETLIGLTHASASLRRKIQAAHLSLEFPLVKDLNRNDR